MKTRYFLPVLLLLFFVNLMAQTQVKTSWISADGKTNVHTYTIDKDEVALMGTAPHVWVSNHQNPCKVFIGVGTTRDEATGGLTVDYTIDNTPAETYGVQEGDIILAIDDVKVGTQTELENQRDKHQQGDSFTLNILRNGSPMTIQARFKTCSEEEMQQAEEAEKAEVKAFFADRFEHLNQSLEMRERPILGIYKDEAAFNEKGIVIREVIEGKGAEKAGLLAGDVITIVDGKSMSDGDHLYNALIKHQPGDRVTVVYLRNGENGKTEVTLSGDPGFRRLINERDPCKVFIGVYTTETAINQSGGVRVLGVIDNTPAYESAVQEGDIILALDEQPIHTSDELRSARDKHQPGDQFQMTILREGAKMNISATFKICPQQQTTAPAVQEPTVLPNLQAPPTAEQPETTLQLESFDAYPSPTLGPVNIRFEANAVPTTVRMTDMNGKVVYENQLKQFNGSFNEQVNLEGKSPGFYTVTVTQDNKVFSKKIILLSRV